MISFVMHESFNQFEPNTIGASWHSYVVTVGAVHCEYQIGTLLGKNVIALLVYSTIAMLLLRLLFTASQIVILLKTFRDGSTHW
jgi:hypothetical protein